MRSALAGTASNVVAVKTAAAVPMNVIERMFTSISDRHQRCTIICVSSKDLDHLILKGGTFLSSLRNIFELPMNSRSASFNQACAILRSTALFV